MTPVLPQIHRLLLTALALGAVFALSVAPGSAHAAAPSFPGMRDYKVSFEGRHNRHNARELRLVKIVVRNVHHGDTVTMWCGKCKGRWQGVAFAPVPAGASHFVEKPRDLVVTRRAFLTVSVAANGSRRERDYTLRARSATLHFTGERCGPAEQSAVVVPCYGVRGFDLWSTISSCAAGAQPPTLDIDVSIPALGAPDTTLYVRYRLYRIRGGGLGRVGLSPWRALGSGAAPHEDAEQFTLTPGSAYQGSADLEIVRGNKVLAWDEVTSTAGHVPQYFSSPAGFSAATCTV